MSELVIKPASTVVIGEKDAPWPPKILLIKRSDNAKFLPGAHVFPGGQVDLEDYNQPHIRDNSELIARLRSYFPTTERYIIGHVASAVREIKEEAGIAISPEILMPLSWWVTPNGESRRFDTWFFLALVNKDALNTPIPLSQEVLKPLWLHPREALLMYERKDIFLAPPTRSILERMAETASLEEFLSFVEQPLRAIHPFFINEQGQKLLVLPGHECHPDRTRSRLIMRTFYSFP